MVTDDGSYGEKAFTTDKLKALLEEGKEYDEIVAVGPPIMMKFVCQLAAEYNIPSVASLTAYDRRNRYVAAAAGATSAARISLSASTA